jgi:hypothetical protein
MNSGFWQHCVVFNFGFSVKIINGFIMSEIKVNLPITCWNHIESSSLCCWARPVYRLLHSNSVDVAKTYFSVNKMTPYDSNWFEKTN